MKTIYGTPAIGRLHHLPIIVTTEVDPNNPKARIRMVRAYVVATMTEDGLFARYAGAQMAFDARGNVVLPSRGDLESEYAKYMSGMSLGMKKQLTVLYAFHVRVGHIDEDVQGYMDQVNKHLEGGPAWYAPAGTRKMVNGLPNA